MLNSRRAWRPFVDRGPWSSCATINLAHSTSVKPEFQGLGMGQLGSRYREGTGK